MKTFAGRSEDWRDIEGIAIRQAGYLDEAYVFRQLDPLLEVKEDRKSALNLRKMLARGKNP